MTWQRRVYSAQKKKNRNHTREEREREQYEPRRESSRSPVLARTKRRAGAQYSSTSDSDAYSDDTDPVSSYSATTCAIAKRRIGVAGTTFGPNTSSASSVPAPAPPPRNYSQLKRAHAARAVPVLAEGDLDEKFVRGGGPGGQAINKTQNNVQLVHRPTGLRVACQDTRSLETNRMLARRWLRDKLDRMVNPGLSAGELAAAKQRERERRRRKKAKKSRAAGGRGDGC